MLPTVECAFGIGTFLAFSSCLPRAVLTQTTLRVYFNVQLPVVNQFLSSVLRTMHMVDVLAIHAKAKHRYLFLWFVQLGSNSILGTSWTPPWLEVKNRNCTR